MFSISFIHVWSDCVSAQYNTDLSKRALVYIASAQICKLCRVRSILLFVLLLWNSGWMSWPCVHKTIITDYTPSWLLAFPCQMFALAQYGAFITLTTWVLISRISQIYRTHKEQERDSLQSIVTLNIAHGVFCYVEVLDFFTLQISLKA